MATSDPFRANTGTIGSDISDVGVKERVSDMATQAREKASELGKNAANAIDSGIHTAADKLHGTASTLRNTGNTGSTRVSAVANRAADGLEATARYIQDYDTREMLGSVEQIVRRNPGPSLIIAAVAGFLIGSALRNNDR